MRIRNRPTTACALAVLCSHCLLAGTVGAPNLSFLFDRTIGAIRPISGIPGAAIVGDPVIFARNAAIAPSQRYALVDSGDNEPLRIWRLDGNPPVRVQTLDGALSPDRIVFSAGGNAAMLVRQSDNAIQVLTGLPDSPAIRSPSGAPEGSSIFAVSDGGDVLAGGDSVWLLRNNEAPRRLAVSGPVSAMAFQGSDALIAGAYQILLVRNLPESSEYRTLAAYSEDRIPVAVQFSPDAARAFAATADGEILVLALEGGDLARLACRCRPTGFHRLADHSLFQLNEAGSEPIWLLDAAAQPRLWFVPRALIPNTLEGPAQ
jgi:hypothetical protein